MPSRAMRFWQPAIIWALLWLAAGPSFAYVLPGLQILDLAAQKNGQTGRLLVKQKVTVYASEQGDAAAAESAENAPPLPPSQPLPTEAVNPVAASEAGQPLGFSETLRYDMSGAFRSDESGSGWQRIHVSSDDQAVTVLNHAITAHSETVDDRYKDIMLYRSRQALADRLTRLGVDTSVSSLGRFEGQVAYVIGAEYPDETLPQLWIDKEALRPLRWIIVEAGAASALDIRYDEWRPRGSIWYPMHIEFYQAGRLVREIEAQSVEVNPSFSKELFDIGSIERMYPQAGPSTGEPGPPGQIQKTWERLRDIFK
jgi:outer membrane lipoprotein-sorting protein